MAVYVDTSALVKLVVAEPETAALLAWLGDRDALTSDLARTELIRAVRRTEPDRVVRAREVLDAMAVLTVTSATFERAALLDPSGLRSLDALHLAAALELGDDLEGMVVYDERLAEAARGHGIAVFAPMSGTATRGL